jgi:hypothetical protein
MTTFPLNSKSHKEIPSVRVPSVGYEFDLNDIHFEIIKSKGRTIQAKGKLNNNKLKIVNTGTEFQVVGSKYRAVGFTIINSKAKLTAIRGDK